MGVVPALGFQRDDGLQQGRNDIRHRLAPERPMPAKPQYVVKIIGIGCAIGKSRNIVRQLRRRSGGASDDRDVHGPAFGVRDQFR